MKQRFFLALALWAAALCAFAQPQLSVSDIYQNPALRERGVANFRWMNDGRYYTAQDDDKIVQYSIANGQAVATLFEGARQQPAIEFSDYTFSADEQKLLIATDVTPVYRNSFTATYYVYDLRTQRLAPLSGTGGQAYATFSPDGGKVAFVRQNNLFFTDLATGKETQVTTDGKWNERINGAADWVYEEEFTMSQAFAWSPDGSRLAYLSFDESRVKEYNMQLWPARQPYPTDYRFKYPKAGEANAIVSAWVYSLANGQRQRVDTGTDTDVYLPRLQWTAHSHTLALLRLNRLQNQIDLIHADAATGQSRVLLSEKTDTYIDEALLDYLHYLPDGQHLLWASERDGYMHLYLYQTNGQLKNQITKGNWDVAEVLGIDAKQKKIYYMSSEMSPMEKQFFSIDFQGKQKQRLSTKPGDYRIDLNRDFTYYAATHTSREQPLNVALYQLPDNKQVNVLEDNASVKKAYEQQQLPQREFFSFKTTDGTELNGYLLKPANFDPQKKYPVLMHVYGGPGSQQVRNVWNSGSNGLWHALLTQKGYIVACVDNRGTGARGAAFKKITYGQLGKYEAEDQLAAARHLAALPFVEAKRIGIWGWSYGGYMSSLCLFLGPEVFKMAIAVAPVTTWRFYDTIYTERYLKRPQDNPEGYDAYSPLTHAAKLNGSFLLVHGTGDDNVHVQNAIALQNALIASGKQFQSFFYPDRDHGIYGGNTRIHLYEMMTDFVVKNL